MSTKLELYFELGHVVVDREYRTEYTLKKLLGRGAYAQCYLATVENNEKFALKVVKLADIKSKKVREKLETEIQIHSMLDHPNIVKMYRTFRTQEYVFMVLELCERGALDTLIKRNGKLKERYVSRFIQQIVTGMMYLHNKMNVVHRDLKLGNLFLDSQLNVKVGDFGLSAVIREGERKVTMCGTPNYIAPEVLFGKASGHSFEADIWSLGVVIYTLLVGVPPFQTKSVEEIYKKIKDNNYVIPDNLGLSSDAIDLITQVLITNPLERSTLEQILNHKFIVRKEHFLLRIYKNLITQRYIETDLTCDYVLFSIPVSKLKGIGYILRSGVYGLYFNDGTSIVLKPNRMSILYFTKELQDGRSVYFKEEHLTDKIPEAISEPYNKLLYFIRTFDSDYKFYNIEPVFIAKVKKVGSGFLYVLSNNSIMFDFVDGNKVVICESGNKVLAFDNLGKKNFGDELKGSHLTIAISYHTSMQHSTNTKLYPQMSKKKLTISKYLTKPSQLSYYGTAGYRSNGPDVSNILCRASLIALIRSSTFAGKAIGLMITASHNPSDYNGIKFVDHNGGMLDESWEKSSDEIVNCEDRDLNSTINRITRKHSNFCDINDAVKGHVVIGRDTRTSGEMLLSNIKTTLEDLGCRVSDYGIVTTPELHFLVRMSNMENRLVEKDSYVKHMSHMFVKLTAITGINHFMNVDTANGVAHRKLKEIDGILGNKLGINIVNAKGGRLNFECGADYVKTYKRPPKIESSDKTTENTGACDNSAASLQKSDEQAVETDRDIISLTGYQSTVTSSIDHALDKNAVSLKEHEASREEHDELSASKNNTICASFDGDADRLVLYLQKSKFEMFDGDAQAVYLAFYISQIVQNVQPNLTIGVVMSYYSNSAATNLLSQSFKVKYAQTGVKNFVKEAVEFDVGIYFEPNGHGSVVFSNRFRNIVNSGTTTNHEILRLLTKMFDPNVGDAIANFLILKGTLTSIDKLRSYEENFSRLMSVKIKNKNAITVNGMSVMSPLGMQDKINGLMYEFKGRSFVRPSGTEDLVRVYAECENERDCDVLCLKTAQLVYDMCEGVSAHPEIDYTK